jgi:PBSX family phage portal protein
VNEVTELENNIVAKTFDFEPEGPKFEDPFQKDWSEIKDMRGLDTNFKRRTSRVVKGYEEESKSRPTGRDDAGRKSINSRQGKGYATFDVIQPPYDLVELANFYDSNFANHAAIDAKVENIVGLGYDWKITNSTMQKIEELTGEKLDFAHRKIERLKANMEEWLESLNNDSTFTGTMEKVYTDMLATGNGYLEVGRTTTGEIGYLGHIPAPTMRVRRIHDGYIQIVADKVIYFRKFGATNPNPVTNDPRPNEIIHFKEYSPLNTYYGIPDVISALQAIKGDQFASQYNIDYFENKAVPRYIVTVKGAQLSPESEERLFRFLQTGLKGQNHRTLYVPLPSDAEGNKVDFEMHPVENTVQDGSFKDYRKQNRDDILMAHQVPISKMGGGDGSAVAAALSQDRTFKEQVTRPAQRHLQKAITQITKEKTDVVELTFKEATLTDEIALSQIHERYLRNKAMTPNEVREDLGLPARKGGDKMVEMSPQAQASQRQNAEGNSERQRERVNNQSDGPATIEGRAPKGEGPKTD